MGTEHLGLNVFCQFRLDQLTVTVENAQKPQDTEPQEYVIVMFLYYLSLFVNLHKFA